MPTSGPYSYASAWRCPNLELQSQRIFWATLDPKSKLYAAISRKSKAPSQSSHALLLPTYPPENNSHFLLVTMLFVFPHILATAVDNLGLLTGGFGELWMRSEQESYPFNHLV